jgi:stage II sporulation protein D (peptidoglycan lytic transglycosylase)
MKLKRWTHIGVALIVVNAGLLGGIRAEQQAQGTSDLLAPSLEMLRARLGSLWQKPPKLLVTPVTIRLFSEEKLGAVWLKNSAGFALSGRPIDGTVFVRVQEGKLWVFNGRNFVSAVDALDVSALDEKPFLIRTRQGTHRWTRGELRLSVVQNQIQIVNRLEVEDYVGGVLEGELGTLNLSPEVLKAQIVVARSYVLSMRGTRHPGEGYEFCDSPHCQVYGGIPQERHPALEVALAEVRGQYLSYNGQPAAAFYHHNCGGETSAVDDVWPTKAVPYLVPVKEAPNSVCRYSPKSKWHLVVSKRWLTACFRHAGWFKRGETLELIDSIREDDAGRVQLLFIQSSRRALKVRIGRFRNVLNQYFGGEPIRSALFTISVRGGAYLFQGRGWGHGVGLCQEGAKQLANEGQTYQKILKHYYPHTQLAKLK